MGGSLSCINWWSYKYLYISSNLRFRSRNNVVGIYELALCQNVANEEKYKKKKRLTSPWSVTCFNSLFPANWPNSLACSVVNIWGFCRSLLLLYNAKFIMSFILSKFFRLKSIKIGKRVPLFNLFSRWSIGASNFCYQ